MLFRSVAALMLFRDWCIPDRLALRLFGVLMAAERVVGGVHFPRDVLAGAAIGILSGVLGFFVI